MKNKMTLLTLSMAVASLFAVQAHAQYRNDNIPVEPTRTDSLQAAAVEAEHQQTRDDNRMTEARHDRKNTKAKAKDAKRMERDANSAARESRYALRSERKAQKARRQATKQAERASKARDKSNRN